MSEKSMHINPNDSLSPINLNESDEQDSSFEVLEEESPLLDANSEDPFGDCCDTDWDQLSGSCLCVDSAHWSESAYRIETQQCSESPLTDQSIVLRNRAVVECPKHSLRQIRPKMIGNLIPTRLGDKPSSAMGLLPVVSHRLCATVIACLVGISFALVLCNLRKSYHLSQLREEIDLNKLQHSQELSRLSGMQSNHESRIKAVIAELEHERHLLHELRVQSEQRLNRESQVGNSIIELQKERDQLIDELRAQSERYAAHEKETNNLILDLQAERHRLMEAIEHNKCHAESHHKSCRPRNWFMRNVRKVKESLRTLHKHIPGMQHLHNMFCHDRNLCDEF